MHAGIHCAATEVATLPRIMTACQIFTVVPQQLRLVNYDEAALAKASRQGLHIWIHSSYLVSPWGTKSYNMPFCIKQLRQQVAIGAQGVIFHLPKAPAATLAPPLRQLIAAQPHGSRVVLENKAVRPDLLATYETPEKVNKLIECFIKAGIPRRDIWLCFDTAHLYCSGVKLRTRADAEQWLTALRYPDRIACFHLNGNSSLTYSDRHAIAFGPDDQIWGPRGGTPIKWQSSGAAAIADFCRKRHLDVIVECNFEKENIDAMDLLQHLR